MATSEDLPRIEIQTLADDKEQTCYEKEEESHASINYTSYGEELQNTPWLKLHKLVNPVHVYTKVRSKFKNCHRCLWSSKAVILILVWNLIISIGFRSFFDPSLYTVTIIHCRAKAVGNNRLTLWSTVLCLWCLIMHAWLPISCVTVVLW